MSSHNQNQREEVIQAVRPNISTARLTGMRAGEMEVQASASRSVGNNFADIVRNSITQNGKQTK